MDDLKRLTKKWKDAHVLVVGDAMLDRTTQLGAAGPNPEEQEVPVYQVASVTEAPGGAGNAAMNLRSMGARVTLVAATGLNDEGAAKLNYLLARGGVRAKLVADAHQPTTIKHRVVRGTRTLCRIDQDMTEVHGLQGIQLAEAVHDALAFRPDAILLSDYSKGVLSVPQVRTELSFHQTPHSLLDPRRSLLGCSVPVDVVTPNNREAIMLGGSIRSRFFNIPRLECVVETRGVDGAYMIHRDSGLYVAPTAPVEDAHVCGAGDTFAAALLLGRVAGASWEQAIDLANAAARAAVLVPGTHAVTPHEIHRQLGAVCAARG